MPITRQGTHGTPLSRSNRGTALRPEMGTRASAARPAAASRRIILGWRQCPGFIGSNEVSRRLPDRAGHQDARRKPDAQLRSRISRREQAARPPAARRRAERLLRRSAAHRHLSQGRYHPRHLRHRRRHGQAQPPQDPRSDSRRGRHAGVRARRRRGDATQARRGAAHDLSRR